MENQITVLFPGGFKPLTGAHLDLANRYAQISNVDRVIMLISDKERDGITRDLSMKIFDILNNNPKIEMVPTPYPSPLLAAYEYLFALPENFKGKFAIAASTKGDDFVRIKDFIPNVEKYKLIGDKKGRKIPYGVDAEELSINIDPLVSITGVPISATTLRNAIIEHDFKLFSTGYPNTSLDKIKAIWKLLTGLNESVYSVDYWKNEFNSIINDTLLELIILKENYITRQELSQIESTIDSFFKKYGININFQGQQTHFIDRLNDPRNESPIYMDELVDLFKDLSDEYGDQIATQLQKNKPGAIESDYQFDVPIHMPFLLQFNPRTKMIDLIPKTIKKQKRPWINSDKSQIIYKIESIDKSGGLLTEGGSGGHMNHIHEDHGLTFGDLKEIIVRALSGRLDIEEAVTEKTDGQNIFVTWKGGQIGFARNKSSIINPMTTTELQAKFDNRGPISEAFGEAGKDLQSAFNKIPQDKLNAIFKNGRVFANMEIIYPATKNIISYEVAVLQFHNLVEYDEKGNIIETDATGGMLMQRIINDANAAMQKTFKIIPPQQIKLGKISNFEDQRAAFINEVTQLQNKYNLKDNDYITDYHKAWWADIIKTKAQEMNYQLTDELLNILVYRWAFADKSTSLTTLKKIITDPAFLTWVTEFDKNDSKKYYKQNIEPFESIFLRLGVVVLQNASNFLTANPNKAVQQIKTELVQLIKELQQTNDVKTLDKLKVELTRIQKLGGFDAIVPSEGIVFIYKGHTYKLTGAFAPCNQILGILKYAR